VLGICRQISSSTDQSPVFGDALIWLLRRAPFRCVLRGWDVM